jgi:hypothetical protein
VPAARAHAPPARVPPRELQQRTATPHGRPDGRPFALPAGRGWRCGGSATSRAFGSSPSSGVKQDKGLPDIRACSPFPVRGIVRGRALVFPTLPGPLRGGILFPVPRPFLFVRPQCADLRRVLAQEGDEVRGLVPVGDIADRVAQLHPPASARDARLLEQVRERPVPIVRLHPERLRQRAERLPELLPPDGPTRGAVHPRHDAVARLALLPVHRCSCG